MKLYAAIVLLFLAACAAPAPPPFRIYPEAEAAPPHIMMAVRAVEPGIALHNVSMAGEVFVIQGEMPNGEAITLHVARVGERWVATKAEPATEITPAAH